MTRQEARKLVLDAVRLLVKEQPELLALDVSERALTHQLAVYIMQRTPRGLRVDVEYNRHHANPKRLNLRRRDASDRELRATTVFPDLIVHVRNTDKSNLLVLEIKKPGEPIDYDTQKLRAFRDELGYRHAGHLILGIDQSGRVIRKLTWV